MQQSGPNEATVPVEVPPHLVAEVRELIANSRRGVPTGLSYAGASEPLHVPWLLSWHGLLAAHGAILSLATLYVIVPACKNVYADFKTELPTATKWVLLFAYEAPWWAFWAAAVLWPVMCSALVRATPPDRHTSVNRNLLIGAIVAGIATAVFVGLALLLPAMSLVGSLK